MLIDNQKYPAKLKRTKAKKDKMGYQFFHVESYARTGSSQKVTNKKTGKITVRKTASIREITDEADRIPGNIPHIENPQPPKILFGSAPSDVVEIAEEWAENTTDTKGRKYRKDGLCMLAGIASLPREMEDDFENFAAEVIEWLKEKYGNRLKSVVAHEKDEEHPHLHFYVIPNIGEKFEDIHEGYKASKSAKADGKLKGEQNQAYRAAMRDLQDQYSNKVAKQFGLTRLGPRRRRLSREAWVLEQKQAMHFADLEAIAKKAYQAGYNKGMKKAKQEAEEIINSARAEAEETKSLGNKVGSLVAGLAASWHQPTVNALNAKSEVEDKLAKTEEKVKKIREEEKIKADRRVAAVATELQKEKIKSDALLKDLQQADKQLFHLNEVVTWYARKYGSKPDISLKNK